MGRLLQNVDVFDAVALAGFCVLLVGAYAVAGWAGTAIIVGVVLLSIGVIGGVNGRA